MALMDWLEEALENVLKLEVEAQGLTLSTWSLTDKKFVPKGRDWRVFVSANDGDERVHTFTMTGRMQVEMSADFGPKFVAILEDVTPTHVPLR